MSSSFSNNVVLDAAQSAHYLDAGISNVYELYSGQFVLPLAQAVPTNTTNFVPFVVVQAHAPYRIRNFNFSAKKAVTPPVLPVPDNQGSYSFLQGTVHLPHPICNPDGSFTWNANTSYRFAEGSVSNSTSGFVLGMCLDAFQRQVDNQSITGINTSTAPLSITQGGVGPQVGWSVASNINITSPSWSYAEPSYWPAQLFSYSMVSGPSYYPTVVQSVFTTPDEIPQVTGPGAPTGFLIQTGSNPTYVDPD
jgi:hypothetical protein